MTNTAIPPDVWELSGKAMGSPDMNRDLVRRRVANAILKDRATRAPDAGVLREARQIVCEEWHAFARVRGVSPEAMIAAILNRIDAVSSPEPDARVAEGMVLVPRTPTPEMVAAYHGAIKSYINNRMTPEERAAAKTRSRGIRIKPITKVLIRWDAMIAASPANGEKESGK